MGTLGPLVQRAPRVRDRLWITTVLAVSFLAAAAGVFALAFLLGAMLQVSDWSLGWRRAIAAGGLVSLAILDVVAIRMATYCPLGWKRQTPRIAQFQKSTLLTCVIWGFDTGLAVTTFRVAAITWGAFMLAFLGLSGWLIGVGYGLGFVLPLAVLLWTHQVGKWAVSKTPVDSGLGAMLQKRPVMQFGSAMLLTAAAVILVLQPLP